MNSSASDIQPPRAKSVNVTEDAVTLELTDGRKICAPLAWYPRLAHGSPAERSNWELTGRGQGVHWPDLDEDISVESLLGGRPSGESPSSLSRWLAQRSR